MNPLTTFGRQQVDKALQGEESEQFLTDGEGVKYLHSLDLLVSIFDVTAGVTLVKVRRITVREKIERKFLQLFRSFMEIFK